MIARGALIDGSRGGRDIPYKIYCPVEQGLKNLPLVVWSHGLGGGAEGAAFLARFLASQGYIILHVQHRGSDTKLWEGKPGHPWDVIRNTHIPRSASLDRFRDIPFVLDNLPRLAQEHPEVAEHWDTSRIGMSGHSFGALTTQIMAGQMFPDETKTLIRMFEGRFRAGILYSPVPVLHHPGSTDARVFGPIEMPLFHMTGTADENPMGEFGYERRLAVFNESGASEKHLLVLEGGDHMVFAGSRGGLAENPRREVHEKIIKGAALAFWDAYLKDDARARDWLTGGGFSKALAGQGRYEFRTR